MKFFKCLGHSNHNLMIFQRIEDVINALIDQNL